MRMRHTYTVCWAIVTGLVLYRSLRKCPGGPQLPWPPQLIAPALGFGMLDIFGSLVDDTLGNVMAVGFVVGALVTKGFQPICGKHPCATAQPNSYKNLQQTPPASAPGGSAYAPQQTPSGSPSLPNQPSTTPGGGPLV